MAPTPYRVNSTSAVRYSSEWISARGKRTAATTTVWTMRTTMGQWWDTSTFVVVAQTCK